MNLNLSELISIRSALRQQIKREEKALNSGKSLGISLRTTERLLGKVAAEISALEMED